MPFSEDELDMYPVIAERDVDHVIVIGLRVSEAIRRLFCSAAEIPTGNLTDIHRSVSTHGGREADIEVTFGDPPFSLQIEDKISADFTAGQARAYRERADRFREDPTLSGAACVLCAPAMYLEAAGSIREEFDGTVSHEQLRDVLLEDGPWARELALIVEHAIRQHRRRGTQAPPDVELGAWLRAFCEPARMVGIEPPLVGNRVSKTALWSSKAPRQLSVGQTFLHLDPKLGLVEIHVQGLDGALDIDALLASDHEGIFSRKRTGGKETIQAVRGDPCDPLILEEPVDSQHALVEDMWNRSRELVDWWNTIGIDIVGGFLEST